MHQDSVIPSEGGATCDGVAEGEAASDAVVEGSPDVGDSRRSALSGEVGGSFDSALRASLKRLEAGMRDEVKPRQSGAAGAALWRRVGVAAGLLALGGAVAVFLVRGGADEEVGIGTGFFDSVAELRLRYEFRREIAPYLGVSWGGAFNDTADLIEAEGGDATGFSVVAGLRVWF